MSCYLILQTGTIPVLLSLVASVVRDLAANPTASALPSSCITDMQVCAWICMGLYTLIWTFDILMVPGHEERGDVFHGAFKLARCLCTGCSMSRKMHTVKDAHRCQECHVKKREKKTECHVKKDAHCVLGAPWQERCTQSSGCRHPVVSKCSFAWEPTPRFSLPA